jgi:preprotein translocase subunit SecG
MTKNKGQNMTEYILLVVAVLIVCIYFLANQSGGPMGQSINASLNSIVNEIGNINSQINLN